MRSLVVSVGVLAVSLFITGCASNPEEKSGEDAYRHMAQPMPMDEWVVDDIAADEGDRTDWRAIDLAQQAKLSIEFAADSPEVTAKIGVFDRYGLPIGETTRGEGQKLATLVVDAKKGGRYFLMIRATDGPPTSYQVRVKIAGGSSGGGGGGGDLPDF